MIPASQIQLTIQKSVQIEISHGTTAIRSRHAGIVMGGGRFIDCGRKELGNGLSRLVARASVGIFHDFPREKTGVPVDVPGFCLRQSVHYPSISQL